MGVQEFNVFAVLTKKKNGFKGRKHYENCRKCSVFSWLVGVLSVYFWRGVLFKGHFYILSLKNMQFNFILRHFSYRNCGEKVKKNLSR